MVCGPWQSARAYAFHWGSCGGAMQWAAVVYPGSSGGPWEIWNLGRLVLQVLTHLYYLTRVYLTQNLCSEFSNSKQIGPSAPSVAATLGASRRRMDDALNLC